jgi:hypothetical protein
MQVRWSQKVSCFRTALQIRPMQQTSCCRGTPIASRGAIPGDAEGIRAVPLLLDDDESLVDVVDDWELSFSLPGDEASFPGASDSIASSSLRPSSAAIPYLSCMQPPILTKWASSAFDRSGKVVNMCRYGPMTLVSAKHLYATEHAGLFCCLRRSNIESSASIASSLRGLYVQVTFPDPVRSLYGSDRFRGLLLLLVMSVPGTAPSTASPPPSASPPDKRE